jgi:CRP-like cAMP-binding protein
VAPARLVAYREHGSLIKGDVMVTSADLAGIELFEGLSGAELESCAAMMTSDEVLTGQKLTTEDDFGYSFIVVLDGGVKVKVGAEVVAEMNSGDYFGEVSLVQHQKRNATVVASSRTKLAKVMTWNFEEFITINPVIKTRIDAAVAERTHED